MVDIQLSRIELADTPTLQRIGRQTFYETFAWGNSEEDMLSYLNSTFSEERLAEEINNPFSEMYFAVMESEPVGYMKINHGPAQNEFQEDSCLEIERLYVLKDFQGKNVGQTLLLKALSIAAWKNLDYVWLGVWEKNTKAIRFYEKKGFKSIGSHIFKVGNDEQTDILMKKDSF